MQEIRKLENMHVALWLLKDVAWVSDWKFLGMFMVLPTLAVAVRLAWDTRGNREEFTHSLAVVLWICANTVWMTGEFYYDDTTRPLAKIFFFAGMALMVFYYLRLLMRGPLERRALS